MPEQRHDKMSRASPTTNGMRGRDTRDTGCVVYELDGIGGVSVGSVGGGWTCGVVCCWWASGGFVDGGMGSVGGGQCGRWRGWQR